ncbi:cell division protein FtsX [Saccharobesus litoralis]|uniref:Cell division protein FtsX n=1 Tax=Saccharobesus litoralis TaxID=2172099 RepID=A0A2S0VQT1_9ALTE|nr:permease-like cell division protein FtsX [Saccharobesus litoralis]AWB66575.1 cell division protein FtsX [Saccharobesus litoralis]
MSFLFKERQQSGAQSQRVSLYQRFVGAIVGFIRQWLASLGEIWRDPIPSILTIAVLGVSLTLPATLYVVVKNAESVESNWESASEISLFFHKHVSKPQLEKTVKQIELMAQVESVEFISSQKALAEFEQLSGFGDALQYLGENPLPDVLIVIPQAEYASPGLAGELKQELEALPEVDFGKLDIEWLRRLEAVVGLINDALTSLALLLVVSVVLIVGNTIRLSIINQREQIEVLKLVGATDAFIHRPFLFTGIWYGFFGGVIAWIAIELMLLWISVAIERLAQLYQADFALQGLSAGDMMHLLLISMSLGLFGSWWVVHRQIKLIEPQAT